MSEHVENQEEPEDRLQIFVAVLIAIVIAVAAVIAWRASLAQDAAGDADFDGLHALVNAENTNAMNTVTAYRDSGDYLHYWYASRLAALIDDDLAGASGQQAEQLQKELDAANTQAAANSNFFETRYVNQDGTYDVNRQMGSMWADELREKDLEFESKFAEADRYRTKTQYLLMTLMLLSIAPVLYSLVEIVSGRARYVLIVLGSVIAVAATLAAVWIDLGK